MRVAGLIIGHEILTGKFDDQNGPHLIRRLRTLGAELARLVVLEDDIEAIADEVRASSQRYDAVVTTGGVGPTHDDVTLEAVARGLGRELYEAPELVELMRQFDIPLDDANLRMARIPTGSVLEYGESSRYPVVHCDNVWVFPGVPKLFRAKFAMVEEHFRGAVLHTARLLLEARETAIAERITAIANAHPDVVLGSYPRFEAVDTVLLTLESSDASQLAACLDALRATFHDYIP